MEKIKGGIWKKISVIWSANDQTHGFASLITSSCTCRVQNAECFHHLYFCIVKWLPLYRNHYGEWFSGSSCPNIMIFLAFVIFLSFSLYFCPWNRVHWIIVFFSAFWGTVFYLDEFIHAMRLYLLCLYVK